jgi:DNA topoisomerase-3
VDTTYLSDDIYPKVPATLQGIKDYFPQVTPLLPLKADGKKAADSLPKSKKVFDNKKVTDHHAIIPTGQRPDNLTDLERKVYNLVALRFIAAFYPDCEVSNTTVLAKAGEIDFKVTGRQILKMGWREVFAKETTLNNSEQPEGLLNDSEPSEQKTLPAFVKGESGPHQPQLQEKTTTPPKYYTEATLLRAMETAGKTVEDEELRDAMKENGIGRPSTRAAIIEKLFQRKYIVREKKNIKATELGVNLIQTIISPLLKSAELTGRWEKKLREIERGSFTAQQFLDELKQMTTEVVHEVKADKAGMRCPVCGKGTIIRGRTRYGCSRWREGCTYAEQF